MHWGLFLHAGRDQILHVIRVLHHFSANRTPTPEQLSRMNLSALNPIVLSNGGASALRLELCFLKNCVDGAIEIVFTP